jgi:hypothetical protein
VPSAPSSKWRPPNPRNLLHLRPLPQAKCPEARGRRHTTGRRDLTHRQLARSDLSRRASRRARPFPFTGTVPIFAAKHAVPFWLGHDGTHPTSQVFTSTKDAPAGFGNQGTGLWVIHAFLPEAFLLNLAGAGADRSHCRWAPHPACFSSRESFARTGKVYPKGNPAHALRHRIVVGGLRRPSC